MGIFDCGLRKSYSHEGGFCLGTEKKMVQNFVDRGRCTQANQWKYANQSLIKHRANDEQIISGFSCDWCLQRICIRMLTLVDKALLVKLFYVSHESPAEALRRFRTQKRLKKGSGPITPTGLVSLVRRFEETGTLCHRPRSGAPCLSEVRTPDVTSQMDTQREQSTSAVSSAREVARITGIPKTSVFRILHGVLQLYPYKLQSLHQLLPNDTAKRIEFANWALAKIEEDPQWLLNILWTDEAHFSLHGTVNTHNSRIWAKENPHAYTEEPLHSPRVTVWCGFTASIIVGPFFFEEPCEATGWKTCSINGTRYLQMLREKVIPCLLEHNVLDTVTFMQDGAPPHIKVDVKEFLRRTFTEERLIGRHFTTEWPPRSPDLTPLDFWLWGYLKSRVYRNRPSSLVQLKDAIRHAISCIDADMLHAAVTNVITRFQTVICGDGGHIEQVLV